MKAIEAEATLRSLSMIVAGLSAFSFERAYRVLSCVSFER